jgi:hypothetical protein
VSFFASIQRDSRVTAANAISVSLDGSGPGSPGVRTKRPCPVPEWSSARSGIQRDAGATSASRATFRGPVRRSYSAAIDARQLFAAISRCSRLSSTWTSFSASAKVEGETSGPASGAAPKVGGAPGGGAAADLFSAP